MANLTLVIDDEVLKRARIKALHDGTSVNAWVRAQLAHYVDETDSAREAMDHFIEMAKNSGAGSGPEGRTWTRESLYDR